jgi:predicted ferric reductase
VTPRSPHRIGVLVVAVAILLPLIPWLLVGSLDLRFSGRAILKSVANLAAFFAISAWAVNLVLATRIRPVERALGGLENLYRLHRRLGALVVGLAVTHVLFLSLHQWGSALDLYLPSSGWSTFSGVIALVLLIGSIVATLVGRLAYPAFLLVQRLLGLTFLVGAFHTFAVRGTLASSTPLTVYTACLTTAAVLGLGYRLLGGRLGVGRHRYRVDTVTRLDEDAVEIAMVPLARPLEQRAGQFVYASFLQRGIARESHPFTVASAPSADSVRLAVKRLGDFTGSLMTLRAGAEARLEGPFGSFSPMRGSIHPQTWIAGGIGITPFLSWARSLTGPLRVDLYYCTPGAEQAHFLDELFEIADRYPAFRVIPVRKRSLGHLTVNDLEAVNPNLLNGHIFICGPPLMIGNLRAGLRTRGVPPGCIHSETFDFRSGGGLTGRDLQGF